MNKKKLDLGGREWLLVEREGSARKLAKFTKEIKKIV
jgi:hypothetical protein